MSKVFLVFPTGEGKGIARTNGTKGSRHAQFGTQLPEKPRSVFAPVHGVSLAPDTPSVNGILVYETGLIHTSSS
jgi:hypothetical protein